MRSILFALTALLLVVPAQAMPASPAPALTAAAQAFDAAAQAAFLSNGSPSGKSIPDALAAHADVTVIGLIAESVTDQKAADMWEAAQAAPSPADAFMRSVYDVGQHAFSILGRNATRLHAATAAHVTPATAARLAAAAELLVQGESDLTLEGRFFSGSLSRQDIQYPSQRSTVLLPAMKALAYATAAGVVLDGLASDSGAATVDTTALAALIKAKGGTGSGWQLPSGGAFHDLARHLRVYASNRPNATLDNVAADVGRLDAAFRGPQDPASAVIASARLDAAWWAARGEKEGTTPLWAITLNYLNGRADSALYEQDLFSKAGAGGSTTDWGLWALGGGAVVVAIGLVALWRRRGRARAAAVMLALLLALSPALVPAGAQEDGVSHQTQPPAPTVEPLPQDPIAYTAPMRGAYGNVARGPDGILHFAWVGCPGTPSHGCFNVYHRTLDPATGQWSPPQLVADPPENATLARVTVAGGEVHIAWVQGPGTQPGQPLEFDHCLLRPFPCDSATRLSTPGEFTSGADLTGRGDRVFATWSEEDATTGIAKVFGRWWQGGAWSTPFLMSSPTRVARYPAATIDSANLAHVVWQGAPPNDLTIGRSIDYATADMNGVVDAATTLSSTPVDFRVRASIAMQDTNDTVGVVYNGVRDLFVMEHYQGKSSWQSPVNVTRTQRLSQSWPILNSHNGNWVVTWVTGTIGQFQMWQAHRENNFWLRPEVVVQAPYNGILFFPQAVVAGDKLHVVWTGNASATYDLRMLYDAWPAEVTTITPPEIYDLSPANGAWSSAAVRLSALVASAAPVTQDGALWEVDGNALTTVVDSDGRVHADAHLADGPHKAHLQVEDVRGGKAAADLTFQVDSTPPSFTSTVRVGGRVVANATGWQDAPVTVEATPVADGGSAVHMQIDYNGVGAWSAFNGSARIPEGSLVTVRLRAIDDAQNVGLGAPFTIGWDDQVPDIALAMPRWSNGQATPVGVTRGDSGSPVTVALAITKATGEAASSTTQPLATLQLPALPEGSYRVHATATDAVGHAQDVGTWDLGVDAQAPTVALQGGSLHLQDRGASGLANVTFPHSDQPGRSLAGPEATLERGQLPNGGNGRFELLVRDQAGNQWHGTVDLATGEVKEIVLDVAGGSGSTTHRAPALGTPLIAAALLGLGLLLRRRTAA